jgi:hypothetical protein
MSQEPRRGVLPTPVWLVLGGAVGAAIGSGGGGSGAGLAVGLAVGAAAGYGVALVLGRRRGG